MPKIYPFLWFDSQAKEAANLYCSIFPNSKIGKIALYGKGGPGPERSVMTVSFTLDGQEFTALNAGPRFKFTEAVSFVVNCKDQAEVDEMWEKLSEGGNQGRCGWLKDKFGLSWQIVPTALMQLVSGADAERSRRVMAALMQMTKLDIVKLRAAYEG